MHALIVNPSRRSHTNTCSEDLLHGVDDPCISVCIMLYASRELEAV